MNCYSLYPYFTKRQSGTFNLTQAEKRCIELCYAFKNRRDVRAIYGGVCRSFDELNNHLKSRFSELDILRQDNVLMLPVPSSSNTRSITDKPWPAEDFIKNFTSSSAKTWLYRTETIRKSSEKNENRSLNARDNDRTWQVHAETMSFEPEGPLPDYICLVDDLVTFGGTLLGAREAILEHGYKGEIFAITMGYTWSQDLHRELQHPTFHLEKACDRKRYRTFTGVWTV